MTTAAPWAYLVLPTAVAALLGLVFRPAFVRVAARIGWLAVVLRVCSGRRF